MTKQPEVSMWRELFLGLDRLVATIVLAIEWPFKATQSLFGIFGPRRFWWTVVGCIGFAAIIVSTAALSGLENGFWSNKILSEIIRNYGLLIAAFGAGALAIWRSSISHR